MKRSPFALVSLIAGIMLIIPAVLILVIDGLGLGESHPLVMVAFPVIAILYMVEAPLQMLNVPIAFPVILPLVSYLCGIAGITRKEPKRNFAIAGIVLTTVSMAIVALI